MMIRFTHAWPVPLTRFLRMNGDVNKILIYWFPLKMSRVSVAEITSRVYTKTIILF